MDKARFLDTTNRTKLVSECHELRANLKEWERSFAENNSGRKPGKEDIKKHPNIAAKYKTYNRTRDVLDGKKDVESINAWSPSVRKHKASSSVKRSEQDYSHTPRKTLFATPRKLRNSLPESHPSILDPYDALPASVSPHPYVFKNAIGPTPQRDGKMLGLFDFLSNSGSTPSTQKRKADVLEGEQRGMNVAQTPSRKPTKTAGDLLGHLAETSGGRRHSRTPVSDGKKFLLSHFATPSTMRFAAIAEEESGDENQNRGLDQTPLRSKVLGGQVEGNAQAIDAFETTPACLKRTTSFGQRLFDASGSKPKKIASNSSLAFTSPGTVRTGPKIYSFKGRALSEILRGLRRMEDNDDEDEMDALREIEGNDTNLIVGDSQSIAEPPARVWKKKGQKRTTRRVIMRPTSVPRKSKEIEVEEGDHTSFEEEFAKVEETQAPVTATSQTPAEDEDSADDLEPLPDVEDTDNNGNHNPDDQSPGGKHDFSDSGSDSDYDELASTPPTKKRKVEVIIPEAAKKADKSNLPTTNKSSKAKVSRLAPVDQGQPRTGTSKQKKEKMNKKEKGTINPNAHSHLNFRSLKIRNKNSKGKGRGRFGRR